MSSSATGMPDTVAPRDRSGVRTLRRVANALNSGQEFTAALETVVEIVVEAMDADAATICVPETDRENAELRVAFARRGEQLRTAVLDMEQALRHEVLESGISLSIADVRAEPRFKDALETALGLDPRAIVAVPLCRRSKITGMLMAIREVPVGFDPEHREFLEAVADKVAVAVENDSLMRRLRRDLREKELLLEVSRAVGSTLELDEVLERLFDSLHEVVPFDAAAIFLPDRTDGSLQLAAQRGYADEAAILEVPAGTGIVSLVVEQMHGIRIGDVRKHPQYLAARPTTRSEMAVPIVSGREAFGVINLESDQPEAFDVGDQQIAELIAAHVAATILNAQLHRGRLRRSQVEHELELAREIQLGLFPAAAPALTELEWSALNVPSSAVGGDYYDHLLTSDGKLWLLLADVSGHGLSASLLTASMQTGFRLLAREYSDPAQLAGRLNEILYEGSPANQFVAALVVLLDPPTGTLSYCNAGHLPALIIGADAVHELRGGGLPMGMFPDTLYESHTAALAERDLLAFYTDGIPEATDLEGKEFGLDATRDVLREHRDAPIEEIIPAVRRAVRVHRGRRGGHLDDITVMVARWLGRRSAPL